MRTHQQPGNVLEVFWVFLRLGLTSFGGPVAHLAYFREAFVERRRWLSEKAYADLVALCQFLPRPGLLPGGHGAGPATRRVRGHAGGLVRLHHASVVLLVAFAYGVGAASDLAEGDGSAG